MSNKTLRKFFGKWSLFLFIAGSLMIEACCPVITSFSPNSGVTGTEVTIRGKRFESLVSKNSIKFGGVTVPNAYIAFTSTTKIRAVVPNDAKSGPISVGNKFCTGTSEGSFQIAGIPKPNLVPKSLFFGANNILKVEFGNDGDGAVPPNRGAFSVFVDGRLLEKRSLGGLPDQSFRSPGGSTTIQTNLRLSGSNRRITLFLDPDHEIDELNEFQNTRSRTITPPQARGPDLIISDLCLASNNSLEISVKNIGSSTSQANLQVRVKITKNGSLIANFTRNLPALHAGVGSFTISPSPAIFINSKTHILVELTANNLFSEIDNTNNSRQELLPDSSLLVPYRALLSVPKIRNNIIWQAVSFSDQERIEKYKDWSSDQIKELEQAILTLEKEGRHELIEPPAPIDCACIFPDCKCISMDDAWKIYLAHVAQCLWVEAHSIVPWHLTDLSDEDLEYLLDSRKLMTQLSWTDLYMFNAYVMGTITAWNPRICYEFVDNLKLIKPSQLDTIYSLTDWMRGHLLHISSTDDYAVQYGYTGLPPADKVLYPLDDKNHKTAGCWGTTGLYAAVLRSINIPVKSKSQKLSHPHLMHSRPEFPTIGKSMPHGDNPYTMTLDPSGNVIPSAKLFYSLSEMENKFINPATDCEGNECNTTGEQASYNDEKDQWQLAYDYMADYILYKYATGGASSLNAALIGSSTTTGEQDFVKPLFTSSERTAMISAVRSLIEELGDGDFNAGKAKIINRWTLFHENK